MVARVPRQFSDTLVCRQVGHGRTRLHRELACLIEAGAQQAGDIVHGAKARRKLSSRSSADSGAPAALASGSPASACRA